MISRIDIQKGFDLVVAFSTTFEGSVFRFAGSGNKETESYPRTIIERHRGKAGMRLSSITAVRICGGGRRYLPDASK
jgi:hypothetical protein